MISKTASKQVLISYHIYETYSVINWRMYIKFKDKYKLTFARGLVIQFILFTFRSMNDFDL